METKIAIFSVEFAYFSDISETTLTIPYHRWMKPTSKAACIL